VTAEYALRDIHKPIGVAEYELNCELTRDLPASLATSLPSIESIEAEFSELKTPKPPAPKTSPQKTPKPQKTKSKTRNPARRRRA